MPTWQRCHPCHGSVRFGSVGMTPDRAQMRPRHMPCLDARPVAILEELDQLADLADGKAKVGIAVAAVSVGPASGGRQKSDWST